MKTNNKGITLTSLIVYIIALTIIIAVLSGISKNFYSNIDYITDKGKYISEYNKFNMYFIEDVKNNSDIYSISSNEIIFKDGTVYSYKANGDNSIYRNKVKICRNVYLCEFTKSQNANNKNVINVHIYMNEGELLELSTDYVLKYW